MKTTNWVLSIGTGFAAYALTAVLACAQTATGCPMCIPGGYAVQNKPAADSLTARFSGLLPPGQWLVAGAYNRAMPTRAEFFIWHSPVERWQVGIAFLAKPSAVRLLVNHELSAQQGTRPALNIGVGLQEVGAGNPGMFLTASWALTPWLAMPSSAYVGIGRRITARGDWLDERWEPLLGASLQFTRGLSATLQMDGRHWHGLLTTELGDLRVGLFAFQFREVGLIIGWQGF